MILADKEELLELRQIPTPEHPQAIVMATIRDGQGRRQGIGVAEGYGTKGKYQPGKLLDAASQDALEKARKGYEQTNNPQNATQSISRNTSKEQEEKSERVWTHNQAAGSISDKQLDLLRAMADERNQPLEKITREMFDATPEELSSEQAQPIIKKLKKMGNKAR